MERAILAGDAETGVCVMGLESTLDTGAVYATRATNIGTKSAADLLAELAVLGAETLIDVLATPGGLPAPQPQRGVATYADKLTPNDFFLAPSDDTAALLAKVRCGRAFSYLDGVRYKVLVADAVDHVGPAGSVTKEGWWCAMTGALRPLVLQAEGSRSMNLESWLAGRRGAMPRTWGIEPTSAP